MTYSKTDLFDGAILTLADFDRDDFILRNINLTANRCELHYVDGVPSPHLDYSLDAVMNLFGMKYFIKNTGNYDIF